MPNFEADPAKLDKHIELCQIRAGVWLHRARTSYLLFQDALCENALMRRWQYLKEKAELEGRDAPAPPRSPEIYFGQRGNAQFLKVFREPDDPQDSGVARH